MIDRNICLGNVRIYIHKSLYFADMFVIEFDGENLPRNKLVVCGALRNLVPLHNLKTVKNSPPWLFFHVI